MSSPASKLVAFCLVSYFVSRIVASVMKLNEGKIGTTITRRNSPVIYYPTMTFCPFRNSDRTVEDYETGVNVTILSDTLIAHDDQNVTFGTDRKNFVRHIGFYYANRTT